MEHDLTFYIQIAVAIFTIMDPFGAIPLFISLTSELKAEEKKHIIRRTVIAVIIILLICAIAGNAVLNFFGINIFFFQIAGGIYLMLIAFSMLQAKSLIKTTSNEQDEADEKEDISVVPLAIPLLAGPGTISIVIIFSSSMTTIVSNIIFFGIIVAVSLTIWPTLWLSKRIGETIGRTGINIAIRIMGLILASIAVKFILEGIRSYLA